MKGREENPLNTLDLRFAEFVATRATPEARALVRSLAAEVSCSLRAGHICLALRDITQARNHPLPPLREMRERLLHSKVVTTPGGIAPLVLDNEENLYLHRYHEYEETLAAGLWSRLKNPAQESPGLSKILTHLGAGTEEDWQRMAAFVALQQRFCIITGGPGTGKTWTIVRLLALLLELDPTTKIALAAPTGRAAARVRESIDGARATLPGASLIPNETSTLHRLLGTIPESPRFRHNTENPLPHDVVVIDEASMVDLPMMSKLVSALQPHARLILVGDSDQLSSVQAGSVLADLSVRRNSFSPPFAERAISIGIRIPEPIISSEEPVPLADCVVELRENRRFDRGGTIQRFCDAARRGQPAEALALTSEPDSSVRLVEIGSSLSFELLLAQFTERCVHPWLQVTDPKVALLAMRTTRMLCAHRQGRRGADEINRKIEEHLVENGLVRRDRSRYYHGRPIMVLANDYTHDLFNGDSGVLAANQEGLLRAYFDHGSGSTHPLHPALLPAHETSYAMSIHKSQGSEFDHVVIVLPEEDSLVLCRELIYTAVSRARKSVEIWGAAEILALAIGRPIRRASGLASRMLRPSVADEGHE